MEQLTSIHPDAIKAISDSIEHSDSQTRRLQRGLDMARSGMVQWHPGNSFALVKSGPQQGLEYMVNFNRLDCGCPDAQNERSFSETYNCERILCKHTLAAMLYRANIEIRMATPLKG